jgi:hypothetical protein
VDPCKVKRIMTSTINDIGLSATIGVSQ